MGGKKPPATITYRIASKQTHNHRTKATRRLPCAFWGVEKRLSTFAAVASPGQQRHQHVDMLVETAAAVGGVGGVGVVEQRGRHRDGSTPQEAARIRHGAVQGAWKTTSTSTCQTESAIRRLRSQHQFQVTSPTSDPTPTQLNSRRLHNQNQVKTETEQNSSNVNLRQWATRQRGAPSNRAPAPQTTQSRTTPLKTRRQTL